MIDFVYTPPFLRIALQVAMATMHFHIAQPGFFMKKFFRIQWVPGKNVAPIQNYPWGARSIKGGRALSPFFAPPPLGSQKSKVTLQNFLWNV